MTQRARYGLRFWQGKEEIRLWQISGSGRLQLRNQATGKVWWAKSAVGIRWQPYLADGGQTFPDLVAAEETATNLGCLMEAGRAQGIAKP